MTFIIRKSKWLEVVSKPQISFKIKARVFEKTQHMGICEYFEKTRNADIILAMGLDGVLKLLLHISSEHFAIRRKIKRQEIRDA